MWREMCLLALIVTMVAARKSWLTLSTGERIPFKGIPYSKFYGPARFDEPLNGTVAYISLDDICANEAQAVALLQDKIAVYVYRNPIPHGCTRLTIYKAALRAGAKALVTARSWGSGSNAGIGGNSRPADLQVGKPMPFFDADVPHVMSESFDAEYERYAVAKHAPPAGASDPHVIIYEAFNPWARLFTSAHYQFFVRWLPATEYLTLALAAASTLERRRCLAAAEGKTRLLTPDVVLMVEFVTSLVMCVFFAIGLYYATDTMLIKIQNALITQFMGTSICTTALVAIFYRGLRVDADARTAGSSAADCGGDNDPLLNRPRATLAILVITLGLDLSMMLLLGLGVIFGSTASAVCGPIYLISNLVAGVLFLHEALRTLRNLKESSQLASTKDGELLASDAAGERGDGDGANENMREIRRQMKWVAASGATMIGYVLVLALVAIPTFFYTPLGWFLLWASLTQIIFVIRFTQGKKSIPHPKSIPPPAPRAHAQQ